MECNISKSTEAELTLCTVKILPHTRDRFLASVAHDQHYGTIYKPLKFLVFNYDRTPTHFLHTLLSGS